MSFYMKWFCLALVTLIFSSSMVLAEDAPDASEGKEESETKSEALRVGHIDLDKVTQQALISELRQKEVVWLDVEYPIPEGGSSAGSVQVLALQRPSQKPQQHGAVLLVPGIGQHADWPQVIRPVRSGLPEAGWYTLALSLPGASIDKVPERALPVKKFDELELSPALAEALNNKTAKNEDSGKDKSDGEAEKSEQAADKDDAVTEDSSDPDKPVDIDLADKEKQLKAIPYQDKALAHVNAGISYLQQQGYQNIVLLAYRASANIAFEYLKQKQGTFSNKGFALVLVDPEFDEPLQVDLAEHLGQNFQPPVLEMVNSVEDESSVKARLASANVAGAINYMQVDYAFNLSEGPQKNLVRRIRYWLEKYAPGMIVGNRSR
ncbi:hypothetical protein A3752_05690 [Oleiphilus sp. HI0081]|nr:hypothetical protein A3732_14985 [Oleiphilus sp. HI0050]KZZ23254.1 hypothetical protein A3752_05690 [Oleiphilus sp. HI0081]